MMKKLIFLITIFMLSQYSYSQISRQEWVSLCENAAGETKQTCDELKNIFPGTWPVVYYELKNSDEIRINHTQISDLSPLSGFSNLKTLHLENNKISDLSPLAGLNRLELLHLENNKVSDLSPLNGVKGLLYLFIGGNSVTEFSPVAEIVVVGKSEQILPKKYQVLNRSPKKTEVVDADLVCPICLNKYEDGEDLSEVGVKGCHHKFHKACLGAWLLKHDNCPFCRVSIPQRDSFSSDSDDEPEYPFWADAEDSDSE